MIAVAAKTAIGNKALLRILRFLRYLFIYGDIILTQSAIDSFEHICSQHADGRNSTTI